MRRHHHQALELRQHHGLALPGNDVGRDWLLKQQGRRRVSLHRQVWTPNSQAFHTESTTVRTIDD
jgi:hypothetical protein